MDNLLTVLIVEDSESDVQLIARLLKKAGYKVIFEQVETAKQMVAALEKQTWDVVISDYSLPQFDGRAALELLKEIQLDIPFIVVSGVMGEDSAVGMMKAGAHDYLTKDNLARLVPAVERELEQTEIRRERKRAEDELRDSKERFESTIYAAGIATWEWNVQTGEAIFNERWAEIVGYSLKELAPVSIQTWIDLAHPDDLKRSNLLLEMHFNGEIENYEFESRMKHKNGQWVWVLDRGKLAARTADGKPLRVLGTHTDITNRKQAEDQLRQLSRAVEYSPASIMITDMDGKIEYINPKFTKLNGYTLEDVRGKTPRVLKSGQTPPEVYSELWQTILSGTEWHGEFLNRKKDGELYWEYASISAIIDSKGDISHFVSLNEDITDRKAAGEKIRLLNAELEQLALTDYLTNLYNRRYFMQRGAEEFKRANRTNQSLALFMLDVDEFKKVNDNYGHEAGDLALQQVAAALKSSLRETDILGRMGGEEFAILLPDTMLQDATLLAERIRQTMENISFQTPGAALVITITISIGVAVYESEMFSIDDLLRNADSALYYAKNSGRNRVIIYNENSYEAPDLPSGLDGNNKFEVRK